MTTRQQIIDYARTFVGTRFQHQGRSPRMGLDCVGVIACVARHFELTSHDYNGYSNRPDGVSLTREFDACLTRIRHAEVQPGDVLTFWVETPRLVQHTALATEKGLIHAVKRMRQVIEHGMDSDWQSKVSVCYRFPGVDPTPYPSKYRWVLHDPEVVRIANEQIKRMGKSCCGG